MNYVLHSNNFSIKEPKDYYQARQEQTYTERSQTQLEILHDVVKKSKRKHYGYVNEN